MKYALKLASLALSLVASTAIAGSSRQVATCQGVQDDGLPLNVYVSYEFAQSHRPAFLEFYVTDGQHVLFNCAGACANFERTEVGPSINIHVAESRNDQVSFDLDVGSFILSGNSVKSSLVGDLRSYETGLPVYVDASLSCIGAADVQKLVSLGVE